MTIVKESLSLPSMHISVLYEYLDQQSAIDSELETLYSKLDHISNTSDSESEVSIIVEDIRKLRAKRYKLLTEHQRKNNM